MKRWLIGGLLIAATTSAAGAQEEERAAAVLRRAQAEHWMVRLVTVSGDTLVGRVERATSETVRLQDPRVSVPVADIALVQHGLRDESDERPGTGLVVIGALLAGGAIVAMGDDPNILLVAGAGIVAAGALVWYAITREDESLSALRWVEEWPRAQGDRSRPPEDGSVVPDRSREP